MNWFTKTVCARGMKLRLSLLLPLLLWPSLSFAQASNATAVSFGPVISPYTTIAANAPYRVCLVTAIGLPCSTAGVFLFSDPNLTQPLSNPSFANAQGIVNFFAAVGTYQIQLTPTPGQTYTYYAFSQSGGGGGGGPVIQTNNVNNISQSLLNFTNPSPFNGLNFAFSNPSGGNETFTITGTLNNAGITHPQTTVNGQPCVLGGSCSIALGSTTTFEHNDIALGGQFAANPQIFDVNDTTPTAPAGDVNVTWQPDIATGRVSGYVPGATGSFTTLVTAPVAGRNVILYPTAHSLIMGSTIGCGPTGAVVANNTSGIFAKFACNAALVPGETWGAVYSGWTLPPDIPAANVTAVYAVANASYPADLQTTSITNPTGEISCTVPAVTTYTLLDIPTPASSPQAQFSSYLAAFTGSQVPSIQCTAQNTSNADPFPGSSVLNLNSIALVVYYTGPLSSYTNGNEVNVVTPLYYNPSTSALGIDLSWAFPGIDLQSYTVATLPAASIYPNTLFLVRDGASSSDCSIGLGSTPVECYSNGTSYSVFSGGGGGGIGYPGGSGVPQVVSGTSWGSTYNATNLIPGSFIAKSTSSTFGVVEPDNSTCTVSAGVLTCPGTAGAVSGVTGSSPIVVSPTVGAVVVSCPTCSVGSGTSTTVNGGSALGSLNINATTPSADSNFLALTPKIATSNMIIEAPYATSSTYGVVEPDNSTITATGGVLTAVAASGANAQYVYRPNCSTGGTTLNAWAVYSTASVNNACVVTAPTSLGPGVGGAGGAWVVGIVVGGAGTTGLAKIATSGTVNCQFDSSAVPTQGQYVSPSGTVAGDCVDTTGTPANENPNGHIFYATVDTTSTAGSVTTVDLMTIPDTYGNYGYTSAGNMTLLAEPAYGGGFGVPSLMQQSAPTGTSGAVLLPLAPFQSGYVNGAAFWVTWGLSNLGTSGNDFLIDTISHQPSSSRPMVRFNGSTYNVPYVASVSGTYAWDAGAGSGNAILTLAGNTTFSCPTDDNQGHIITVDLVQAASLGPYTVTWNTCFKNPPAVSAVASSHTVSSYYFDGTNYDCIYGCATTSNISGLTAGYIPLAGSSSTLTGNSPLDYGVTTTAVVTSTKPLAINTGGSYNVNIGPQGTMTASWNFDTTTPASALLSLGGGPSDVQITVGTTPVPANGCLPSTSTYYSVTMSGLQTTSAFNLPTPSGFDPSTTTGWSPAGSILYFVLKPTLNTLNWQVCNQSGSPITPGSSTAWNIGAK